MSYKYDPYTDSFEHIPDEQPKTATISINTSGPSHIYQTVYLADECIDQIADAVVRKMRGEDDDR